MTEIHYLIILSVEYREILCWVPGKNQEDKMIPDFIELTS